MTATFVLLHLLRFALLVLLAVWLLGEVAHMYQTWILILVWAGMWPTMTAILFARTLRATYLLHATTDATLVEPFLVVGTFLLPFWVGLARSPAFRRQLSPTRALALGLILGGAVDLQEGIIDALRGGMSLQIGRIAPLVQHPLDYLVFGIRVWDVYGHPYSAYAMAYGLALVCGISAGMVRKGLPPWLMPLSLAVDAIPHALTNKAISTCLFGICPLPPFPREPFFQVLWSLTLNGALPTLGLSIWLVLAAWQQREDREVPKGTTYLVRVVETGTVLAEQARVAHTAWERFVGLMGRPVLTRGDGLILPRTRWVHTLFMRFPIDVLYVNNEGRIIAVDRALRPWRVARPHFQAERAIELPAGTANNVEIGQHVELHALRSPTDEGENGRFHL